jgi:hypothetical protein
VIEPIHPADISEVWQDAWPKINRALVRTDKQHLYPLGWIKGQLKDGYKQLWCSRDFRVVLVTGVEEYPSGVRELIVFIGAGKMADHLDDVVKILGGFAQSQGCEFFSAAGRKGWARKFPQARVDYRYTMRITP